MLFTGEYDMKIGVCTTTIHTPHALKVLRKFAGSNVKFFIALDENSDLAGISRWGEPDDQFCWMTPDWQKKFKCSEALGWKTLSRRNTAFLAALEWGCDAIYSHDDDNLVTEGTFFEMIEVNFEPFNGIKVSNAKGWFDPGSLLIPATRQRGVPWNHLHANWAEPVIDAKVGVVSGLIVGDPDCDASTRMEKSPDIGSIHVLGQAGVVVDPKTWTIFNSQNTTILRELIPAFFLMPGVGRHDDVFGSLIVQRVMRERGYHVHLGAPFCYQARNPHNLVTDLRAEIDGMENVRKLADLLDHIVLPGKSVIEDTCIIYSALRYCDFLPIESVNAALLWIEDVGSVL